MAPVLGDERAAHRLGVDPPVPLVQPPTDIRVGVIQHEAVVDKSARQLGKLAAVLLGKLGVTPRGRAHELAETRHHLGGAADGPNGRHRKGGVLTGSGSECFFQCGAALDLGGTRAIATEQAAAPERNEARRGGRHARNAQKDPSPPVGHHMPRT